MSGPQSGRRKYLRTTAVAGVAIGASGLTSAGENARRKSTDGFPPSGIAEWGAPVSLGDGTARTFTTVTPSGTPKYHGLYFERDALDGLPSAGELEAASECRHADKYGEALQIHHRWSQEFFLPIPA